MFPEGANTAPSLYSCLKEVFMVKNPILRGFHPDPSLIRVGGDYYLATSTFEWAPGVRIYHSKDLAHWDYLTAPLDTYSKMDLRGVKASDGIWAPCLSHDVEYFYLIYTVVHDAREFPVMDTPNYLIRAKEITGPWSDPVYLNSSGFDPSLFHDTDGRKWLLNMEWDYRKVLSGGNPFTGILLQEYDPEKKQLTGEAKKIFTGSSIGSTEGPHLYRHDGYYYLMCAEGGTGWFHAVTLARSKALTGPYELSPEHPVLTSWEGSREPEETEKALAEKDLGKSYLKKAGHGSLVESKDGRWFLAHLCGRNLPGMLYCPLGRETAIQEVVWEDGWLKLKEGGHFPKETFRAVSDPETEKRCDPLKKEYHFRDESFLEDFQTLRSFFRDTGMTIREREGYLRIYGRESIFSRYEQALLARRQTELSFEAAVRFEFFPTSFQHGAGLIYRYDERNQYYAYVTLGETGPELCLMTVINGQTKIEVSVPVKGLPGEMLPAYELSLSVKEDEVRFFWLDETGEKQKLGPLLHAFVLSDDFADGFTGAFTGVAVQDMKDRRNYADVAWFRYEEQA